MRSTRGIFQRCGGLLCQGVEMRYRCIDRRRSQDPVRMMCRLLKVSRSGYYAWWVRPETQRSKTDRQLTRLIRHIHVDSVGAYEAVKITTELREDAQILSHNQVIRVGLFSLQIPGQLSVQINNSVEKSTRFVYARLCGLVNVFVRRGQRAFAGNKNSRRIVASNHGE